MKHLITTRTILNLVMSQLIIQQQLIEAHQQLVAAQKEIINLQRKIERMTPKNLPDKGRWHIKTGTFPEDAASSSSLEEVQAYCDWTIWFGKKYLKPFLNAGVYSECMGHIQRGLPAQLAKLETEREAAALFGNARLKSEAKPILKIPAMQDA